MMQAQRDDRRISGSPSRTHRGIEVRSPERVSGTRKQREFTRENLEQLIGQLSQQRVVTPELVIRPSAFPDSAAKAPIIQPIAF